jgi:K+/H+ antiporter YhaU regulatory subunit KhtT
LDFFSGIVTLAIIALLALLINRIAAVALVFTGMSHEMARFQARSAFSTVGFTTTESESVVNHPVRRKVISVLMVLGNVGFVGIIATVLATFTAEGSGLTIWARILILTVVLAMLWGIGASKWLDNRLYRAIAWALTRWTKLEAQDYVNLLHMGEGYWVTELIVREEGWVSGKRLEELHLTDIGVIVLGIERTGKEYIGSPTGQCQILAGDKLLVYGSQENLANFEANRSDPDGEKRHRQYLEKNREDSLSCGCAKDEQTEVR